MTILAILIINLSDGRTTAAAQRNYINNRN
jgi:hypothetical protein